jgi:hypothetical protein
LHQIADRKLGLYLVLFVILCGGMHTRLAVSDRVPPKRGGTLGLCHNMHEMLAHDRVRLPLFKTS